MAENCSACGLAVLFFGISCFRFLNLGELLTRFVDIVFWLIGG